MKFRNCTLSSRFNRGAGPASQGVIVDVVQVALSRLCQSFTNDSMTSSKGIFDEEEFLTI